MNELDQRNHNNGQLSGNMESADIDLHTAMGSDRPQTEHENATEDIQKDLTANENIKISEKKET